MSHGDADTWDPEIHGAEAGGDEPQPTPLSAAPARELRRNPSLNQQRPLGSPRQAPRGQWQQAAPPQGQPGSWQQVPMNQQPIPQQAFPGQMQQAGQRPAQQASWGQSQGQMGQPRQSDQVQAGQRQGPGFVQTAPEARRSYEHYRDAGILPWWAWAGIGAVVISCGLLATAVLSPSTLDPDTSVGFDPRLHEKYADMTHLQAGSTFTGTVDSTPWEVRVSDINWDADEQASVQTSLPEAADGMKYVGVELDLVSDFRNITPVDEAFLFHYLTPGGQEYSKHYCGYGCLTDNGSYDYTYDGWIYFEVPQSVPEGGHIRINLLYSGETDTLLELP